MKSSVIGFVALLLAWPAQAQLAEPNDQGVSFGHMHLVVADLDLHKQLWPDLFGAELVENQGYSAVRITDALIFLREAEPTAPSVATAVDHFGITVQNVEAVLARWRTLGYEVDSQTTDECGHITAYITMPGGIRLALTQDPDHGPGASMDYVQITTTMRGELMAWYADLFGAKAFDGGGKHHAATVPGSELRFDDAAANRLPTDGASIDHIGFEVQKWDEFVAMLRGYDIEFEFGPVYIESLELWVAFFNDPSGVLVEITNGLDHF